MKKELVFDIELSPKTRVSNKSQFLTLDTTIKIPYFSKLKQYFSKKNVLVTFTDTEMPNNLDSKLALKEMNKENYTDIDLSECFILLLYFKIEDGKVEMAINHGTSKKKKKRKIDKNNQEEEEMDDSMEGECKFHHYKRPCQFKQWGELQEKQYHDFCEMSITQRTQVDIKTHFVKNRNHKIYMEAELLVPNKVSKFFEMSRRRVGFKAVELINYRFELESEIYAAEMMQKHISKINFSLDNSKITTLKFSEPHFLKTFDQKKVIEIITGLLQLEELDLSEISLKQNTLFYNLLFPNLYQKCYKLKKIILQGPKQQWTKQNNNFLRFLCAIPQRNWNVSILATVPGKEFSLEKFVAEDFQMNFPMQQHQHLQQQDNFQFDPNVSNNILVDTQIKLENPFGLDNQLNMNNMNNNMNMNNNLNNNMNMNMNNNGNNMNMNMTNLNNFNNMINNNMMNNGINNNFVNNNMINNLNNNMNNNINNNINNNMNMNNNNNNMNMMNINNVMNSNNNNNNIVNGNINQNIQNSDYNGLSSFEELSLNPIPNTNNNDVNKIPIKTEMNSPQQNNNNNGNSNINNNNNNSNNSFSVPKMNSNEKNINANVNPNKTSNTNKINIIHKPMHNYHPYNSNNNYNNTYNNNNNIYNNNNYNYNNKNFPNQGSPHLFSKDLHNNEDILSLKIHNKNNSNSNPPSVLRSSTGLKSEENITLQNSSSGIPLEFHDENNNTIKMETSYNSFNDNMFPFDSFDMGSNNGNVMSKNSLDPFDNNYLDF